MKQNIMTISCILALTAILSLNAYSQPQKPLTDEQVYGALKADIGKTGGIYYVDSFSGRDYTPAPKGYKPFYISTYARHGARYILDEEQYSLIHDALTKAHEAGVLTGKGKEIYDRFEALYPSLALRGGDITPLGQAQHKALAQRMYRNYPEIFSKGCHVDARCTEVPRVILSMNAFLEGLREADRTMDIYSESSIADQPFLNPHSSLSPTITPWDQYLRSDKAPWNPIYRTLCASKFDAQGIMDRLFTDTKPLGRDFDPLELSFDLFYLANDEQCLQNNVSFYDIFTEDELLGLWEGDNYSYYARKGPDPLACGRGYGVSVYMLEDIENKADQDIADLCSADPSVRGKAISARLRFGHDGCIMALLTLMRIGTWGQAVSTVDSVKNVFRSYEVPMAANLQFVFYRSKKSTDILFKFLYDEKNMTLPFQAVEGPYYRWTDFQNYYKDIIADTKVSLANSINGAPVNIHGRVTTVDGEPLADVQVSDGIQIVKTDADGEYRMHSEKEQGFVFVITPSDYVATSSDGLQRDFYAHLTAPFYQDETHNFTFRHEDQSTYSVLFITDVHLTNSDEKPDLYEFDHRAMPKIKSVAADLSAKGPVYGMNLGDLGHELYWYKYSYNLRDAYNTLKDNGFPVPLYSVSGNHDNDGAVTVQDNEDRAAEHLYRDVLGPEYYSINIGKDHWIMMDDITYINTPGKGKRYPGINGARDYTKGLTPAEMTFLQQDLKALSDTTPVFICVHSPVTYEMPTGAPALFFKSRSQVDSLNAMLSRFSTVRIFCGHVHRMQFYDSPEYPHLHESMIPATSGNMWTSSPDRELGVDGTDGGIFTGTFESDTTYYSYNTYNDGQQWFRTYDMNQVGKYYSTSAGIKAQQKLYPQRLDYSRMQHQNYIYVNCWYFHPGDKVEMFENGRPLAVKQVRDEDPLFNIDYYVNYVVAGEDYHEDHATDMSLHMFAAKAKSSTTPIQIRISDASGRVFKEYTMKRPQPFGPDAYMHGN